MHRGIGILPLSGLRRDGIRCGPDWLRYCCKCGSERHRAPFIYKYY